MLLCGEEEVLGMDQWYLPLYLQQAPEVFTLLAMSDLRQT